ncbi:MAG: Asp23/Gls24 family envelope stress response protein [Ktedonobacterales bacterium]
MPQAPFRGSSPATSRAANALATSPRDDTVHRAGRVAIAPRAIATIAGRAVAQCYGVVGVAARRPRFGRVELVPPGQYARGVDVRFMDGHVEVDVFVVLEYGLRITEVAHSVMATVKFAVETALGAHEARVNVNVQALRVHAER